MDDETSRRRKGFLMLVVSGVTLVVSLTLLLGQLGVVSLAGPAAWVAAAGSVSWLPRGWAFWNSSTGRPVLPATSGWTRTYQRRLRLRDGSASRRRWPNCAGCSGSISRCSLPYRRRRRRSRRRPGFFPGSRIRRGRRRPRFGCSGSGKGWLISRLRRRTGSIRKGKWSSIGSAAMTGTDGSRGKSISMPGFSTTSSIRRRRPTFMAARFSSPWPGSWPLIWWR